MGTAVTIGLDQRNSSHLVVAKFETTDEYGLCTLLLYQYEMPVCVSTHRHPLACVFASALCVWGI